MYLETLKMSIIRSRGVSPVQGFLMYSISGNSIPDLGKCLQCN